MVIKWFSFIISFSSRFCNDFIIEIVLVSPICSMDLLRLYYTQNPTPMEDRGLFDIYDYFYQKQGKVNPKFTRHLWCQATLRQILSNPIYLGNMAMNRTTTVSYKNHKSVKKDLVNWIVAENTHEPIISQELWDKVREVEKSVSRGKRSKDGTLKPLSGLIYCCDCGFKMKSAE